MVEQQNHPDALSRSVHLHHVVRCGDLDDIAKTCLLCSYLDLIQPFLAVLPDEVIIIILFQPCFLFIGVVEFDFLWFRFRLDFFFLFRLILDDTVLLQNIIPLGVLL